MFGLDLISFLLLFLFAAIIVAMEDYQDYNELIQYYNEVI